jgi:Domain of unknown function (DUF4386)
MDTSRETARIVGVLFIVGTVAGILSAVITGPVLNDSNFLTKVSENKNQMIIGAFFVLIMGLALAMIPVIMFPIFRKYNEILALGAVIFRGALEAILYIAIVLTWLLLLTVSQEYVKAGISDASYFQTLGALLLKAVTQINSILGIVFSLGALIIYYLYYQSGLIPKWLSVWGLIGASLYFVASLFAIFSMDFGILLIPLGLQEIVLAVWMIFKGFNFPVIASEPAKIV